MEQIGEAILIETIMDTRAQVDFLWQFFVTVHIAIFALLFIYTEAVDKLSLLARVFAVAGVAMFDWINGKALINAYNLLEATGIQYRALYGQADRFTAEFYEQFVLADFSSRPDMVLLTHSLALVVVVVALLARQLIHIPGTGPARDPAAR